MEPHELKALQYHYTALETALVQFIKKAPSFEGEAELAKVIGTQMENIQNWICLFRRG